MSQSNSCVIRILFCGQLRVKWYLVREFTVLKNKHTSLVLYAGTHGCERDGSLSASVDDMLISCHVVTDTCMTFS